MDGAFRDIRATQVDMTQLPEQDASSDVTKFDVLAGPPNFMGIWH